MIANDVTVMTRFVIEIVHGTPILSIRDPYLRYVPQAIIVYVVDLFTSLSPYEVTVIIKQYIIFVEGFLAPLVLYWFVRTVRSRLAGISSLIAVAVLQYQVVHLEWLPSSQPWITTLWWHYALSLPFFIAAIWFASRSARRGSHRTIWYSGLCLGIVGSIQAVQGVFTAAIIGAALLYDRDWRDFAIVAGSSILVALPNLVVIQQYGDTWLHQGTEIQRTGQLSSFFMSAPSVAFLVIVGALSIAVFFRGQQVQSWCAQRDDRVSWIANCETVTLLWIAVPVSVIAVGYLLDATWYRRLAYYHLKYALFYWSGIAGAVVLPRAYSRFIEISSVPAVLRTDDD